MNKSRKQEVPASKVREASIVIELFPPDEDLLRDLGERCFLHVRAAGRITIGLMLQLAEILTALPVLVRTLLLFFPRLEEPLKWP
jgi:hypothetical protein